MRKAPSKLQKGLAITLVFHDSQTESKKRLPSMLEKKNGLSIPPSDFTIGIKALSAQ